MLPAPETHGSSFLRLIRPTLGDTGGEGRPWVPAHVSPAALTLTLLPARVTCGGGSFPQLLWDQGRERFTEPGSPGCSQHAVASTFGASGREFLLAGPAPALRVSVRVLGLWLLSGAAGKRGSGASHVRPTAHSVLDPPLLLSAAALWGL